MAFGKSPAWENDPFGQGIYTSLAIDPHLTFR
jgi:hypothetical protein